MRRYDVLRYTSSVGIHRAEVELSIGGPLLGRLGIPEHGGFLVFFDPSSVVIHHAEMVLSLSLSLFGRLGIPKHSGFLVLRDASSVGIHPTEIKLSLSFSLLGRLAIPEHSDFIVPRHASSIGIHQAEMILGIGVSFFGRLGHRTKCRFVVTALVSRLCIRVTPLTRTQGPCGGHAIDERRERRVTRQYPGGEQRITVDPLLVPVADKCRNLRILFRSKKQFVDCRALSSLHHLRDSLVEGKEGIGLSLPRLDAQ